MTDQELSAITAFSAAAAAIIAAASVCVSWRGIAEQNRQARNSREDFKLALAADLSMKLDDRFNSSEYRRIRSKAAKALKTNINVIDAEEVFDFFETVGLLVRSGVLTKELAYNFFFHWINLYWVAGEEHVRRKRRISRSLWENFEDIYNAVCDIERRKDQNSEDIRLAANSDRVKGLLEEEIDEQGDNVDSGT